jgi:hypothetical protein
MSISEVCIVLLTGWRALTLFNHCFTDYDAIDLPVFTCSSRDYVRLKGELVATSLMNGLPS